MIKNKELFLNLKSCLKDFKNMDEILLFCSQLARKCNQDSMKSNEDIKNTEKKIEKVLMIKNLIKSMRKFSRFVQDNNLVWLENILQVLNTNLLQIELIYK